MDLPYPKFAGALKSALKDFRRPDLPADNPLMRSRLMSVRGANPAELQGLLTETVAELFASPRDQKLRRALDLTYFDAELKQEAAAERLGVPFGTYRRHLTTAINRMGRWLWEQEQQEASASVPTSHADAPPSKPSHDPPRLSLIVASVCKFRRTRARLSCRRHHRKPDDRYLANSQHQCGQILNSFCGCF